MTQPLRPRAFTLIELLVVITIIVVLLALLTPALDKAVYQAQLATCGARLDALAGGLTVYAMDHKRAYPTRTLTMGNMQPHHIAGLDGGEGTAGAYHDDRVPLKGYISINPMLNDPLTEKIELENTEPNTSVFTSYLYWYRWRYPGYAGMNRLGDRFEWNKGTAEKPAVYSFSVLASDYDEYQVNSPAIFSNHPDRDGQMGQTVYQNEGGVPGVGNLYLSRWRRGALERGPLDLNFAYADGSVERLADVKPNPDPNSTDRTIAVPQYVQGVLAATDFTRLPPR